MEASRDGERRGSVDQPNIVDCIQLTDSELKQVVEGIQFDDSIIEALERGNSTRDHRTFSKESTSSSYRYHTVRYSFRRNISASRK